MMNGQPNIKILSKNATRKHHASINLSVCSILISRGGKNWNYRLL